MLRSECHRPADIRCQPCWPGDTPGQRDHGAAALAVLGVVRETNPLEIAARRPATLTTPLVADDCGLARQRCRLPDEESVAPLLDPSLTNHPMNSARARIEPPAPDEPGSPPPVRSVFMSCVKGLSTSARNLSDITQEVTDEREHRPASQGGHCAV